LYVVYKGHNSVVKIKVVYSILNSLLILVLVKLKYTNIKRLKNISKMFKKMI
jgi:hypothetical protein